MTEGCAPMELPADGSECVFLHDSLPFGEGENSQVERGSVLFSEPVRTISCCTAADIEPAFEAIEKALQAGLYVAGAFTYELGYHLEKKLSGLAPETKAPLFQLGVFRTMQRLEPNDVTRLIAERMTVMDGAFPTRDSLSMHLQRTAYDEVMEHLHEYILDGDIYQANLTFPVTFTWSGDVWQLYRMMTPFQKVAFGAVVDLPEFKIASLSPELFFQKRGNVLTCRPMKGTMRRGATQEEDLRLKKGLQRDSKNRAENLMIVDLIRNDLSRLSRIGSVCVDGLFEVETYSTLHQMVSTVRAEVAHEPSLLDIFRSLFPCGSITGAPKIRAMEIIAQLEDVARGVYTGAIGYFTPQRDMSFSVPIRTVTLSDGGHACLGVGSGVVADSISTDEYEECLLKARFLKNALAATKGQHGLIETMRGEDGIIPLLQDHRARLSNSALELGITFPEQELWRQVMDHAEGTQGIMRIRVQLEAGGSWQIESARLEEMSGLRPVVVVSKERVRSDDLLLAHKTTRRQLFDKARSVLDGVDNGFDVLLFNERGELCEGAISNVFLKLDGKLVTPLKECGLLPGICRARVIKEHGAEERVLDENDLNRAQKIYLCNAVRGLFEVQHQNKSQ